MIKPKCSYISEAILSLNPLAEFIAKNEYSEIVWLNDTQPISEKEIEDEILLLQASNYKQNRSTEYPSIGDQLDDLFKAGLFSEDMAAKIQAVKDKYPKG